MANGQPTGDETTGTRTPTPDPAPEVNAGDARSRTTRRPPRRQPDLETSRLRIDLYNRLRQELATIKLELSSFCTPASLKERYPGFEIWNLLEDAEILELMNDARFRPKACAERSVLRKVGLTSRQTLKKDRAKVRKAAASAVHPYPSVPR